MIAERRQLVIDSWKALSPNSMEVGAMFYRHLFEIDPTLRVLFADAVLEHQMQKFTAMIDVVIQWLDVPERLVPALKQLGERHTKYGVTDEHYRKVGTALFGTLEEGLGDRFTPELRSAWSEAYLLISSLMRRGAAKISGTFPVVQLEAEQANRRSA